MAAKQEQKPFHERLAEKLIDQLQQGTAPWQKPWDAGEVDFFPVNAATGKRYKGANAVMLMAQGREDNRWVTYKQAEAMGGQVRRGERGTGIIYWKFEDEQTLKDENGRPVKDAEGNPVKVKQKLERPRAFFATVFNAEQIDGLPPRQVQEPKPFHQHDRIEAIMANSGVRIVEAPGDRAFYRPSEDSIRLPARAQFGTEATFYATALHELGHATGHPTRLDRNLSGGFGSESYAREELRAEIASMIVGSEFGTGHDPGQHAAYVGSWVKVLTEQPLEIMRACADAERIADYVMAWEHQQTQAVTTANDTPTVEEELKALSATAVAGYDPQASWHNLRDHGRTLALSASIERGAETDAEGHKPPFVVRYADEAGAPTSITTNLYSDGKALTMVDGERVNGTGYTSDVEWQRAALSAAASLASIKAEEQRREVEQAEQRRLELAAGRAEAAGNIGASAGQCRELAKAIATTGIADNALFGRELDAAAELTSDMAAAALSIARRAQVQGLASIQVSSVTPEGREIAEPSQEKPASDRTYINAPYADRREVRQLGGEWDAGAKSWFIPAGVDPAPFAKWTAKGSVPAEENVKTTGAVESAGSVPKPPAEGSGGQRTYIAVPYSERQEAKALGAKWDAAAKSWFAPPGASPKLVERWGGQQGRETPPTPQAEFRGYLEGLGFQIDGEPVMDGQRHRCRTEGDRKGEKSGFYVGFLDGHPAGYAKNNRTGEGGDWKSQGVVLSPEERNRLRAEAEQKLKAREAERLAAAEAVAKSCAAELRDMKPTTADTRYIKAKGIEAHANAFEDRWGNTVVPAYDTGGRHWSNQLIRGDSKLFAKDGRKEGCFHVVGGQDGLSRAPAIVIAEGYATAATLTEAMGFPTVAAFDAGNLRPVAEALAKAHPDKPIIVAGDDDHKLEAKPPHINRGRAAAEEAAQAVGGRAVLPLFAQPDREAGLTDFNDLATKAEHSPRDVRAQIEPIVRALTSERGSDQVSGGAALAQDGPEQRVQERKPRSVRIGA